MYTDKIKSGHILNANLMNSHDIYRFACWRSRPVAPFPQYLKKITVPALTYLALAPEILVPIPAKFPAPSTSYLVNGPAGECYSMDQICI